MSTFIKMLKGNLKIIRHLSQEKVFVQGQLATLEAPLPLLCVFWNSAEVEIDGLDCSSTVAIKVAGDGVREPMNTSVRLEGEDSFASNEEAA